jgi:broad specificity phosphatase PhoE
MSTDACHLYLVRHGATDNNLTHPPRLQGQRLDAPLSAVGRRQAEQTAAFLSGEPITAIYASPLLRARQTAQAIARPLGLETQLVEALIECDVGQWEGRSWPDIEREEPDAYRRFMANAYEYGYRGGENLGQLERRVAPAFAQLAAANVGRSIVVVAHNVVNRVYLGHLLDVPPAKRRGMPQENCGVNLIRYQDGEAKLITLNSVSHLDGLET